LEKADYGSHSSLEKSSYTMKSSLCYTVYTGGLATYVATPFERPWKVTNDTKQENM